MTFSSGAAAVLPAIPSLVLPDITIEVPEKEVKSVDYQPITDPENV